jgi:hypothetical protein
MHIKTISGFKKTRNQYEEIDYINVEGKLHPVLSFLAIPVISTQQSLFVGIFPFL